MTRKQGKSKRICHLCGGTLKVGRATIPFSSKGKTVVVKDVPAEICCECNEPYMIGMVVDRINQILDRFQKLEAEVSIVHYKAA